jgi:hypothetical protein
MKDIAEGRSPREIFAVTRFEITFQHPSASTQTLESTWESCVALPKLQQRLRDPWNSFLHNAKALTIAPGVEPAIHITMYGSAFKQ